MAAHLQKIIHSTHPEAEEDELSELAMAVGDCEQARAELARHFDNTPFEECIIMSILHNGSDDACGFVCWALHALAADPEHRGSLVTPAVATGLREALVRCAMIGLRPTRLAAAGSSSCSTRATATAAAAADSTFCRRRRGMRRYSGLCYVY